MQFGVCFYFAASSALICTSTSFRCKIMSFYRRLPGRTAALALLSWLLVALVLHLRAERQLSTQHWPSSDTTGLSSPGTAIADSASSNTAHTFQADAGKSTAVVVAKTAFENATWLDDYFPQWEKNVYNVGDRVKKPKFMNKGRESMVYLRCVIGSNMG
jgi:hypothetical protein